MTIFSEKVAAILAAATSSSPTMIETEAGAALPAPGQSFAASEKELAADWSSLRLQIPSISLPSRTLFPFC